MPTSKKVLQNLRGGTNATIKDFCLNYKSFFILIMHLFNSKHYFNLTNNTKYFAFHLFYIHAVASFLPGSRTVRLGLNCTHRKGR